MIKTRMLTALLLLLVLTSCEFKCSVNKDGAISTKEVTGSTSDYKGKPQLLNNISLEEKGGVKVFRAFLADEQGNLVNDNITSLGQPLILNLMIHEGWQVKDGKTFLGASQRITTNQGLEILNTSDLFTDYDSTGLDPNDAKMITLRARITNATGNIDHFQVEYRVWDKLSDAEITGKYQFKVKETIAQ